MEVDSAGNGPKLRRGRISLERKKEILEEYDRFSGSCTDADVAAKVGVTLTTLLKILSEREEAATAVETEKGKRADDSDGPGGSQKELLASDRSVNSGKRKRSTGSVDSTSDSDSYETPRGVPKASGLRRGRISAHRRSELLEQFDKLPEPVSYEEAAAALGVSQVTLAKLLASREAGRQSQPGGSGIRRSSQPRTSGPTMTLRAGRRVRVDYSEDEQSGSDYKGDDGDSSDSGAAQVGEHRNAKATGKHRRYTRAEREKLLAKYDELKPIPQWRAAQILGITQSTLCSWLQHRKLASTKTTDCEKDEDSLSGEEIDCYILGSSNGSQLVQFYEVKDSANSSNAVVGKRHLTMRERHELYKKYDSMDAVSQRNAAVTFNMNKSTWANLLTNRLHYEMRFKKRLKRDMELLKRYDELENKKKTFAAKKLGVATSTLYEILASRETIEKYYNEMVDEDDDDDEWVDENIHETESTWKNTLAELEKELMQWTKQAKNEKVLNWKVLKAKAKELAAEYGMIGFRPTDEWLMKWNKEYQVFRDQRDKWNTVFIENQTGKTQGVSECVLMALKAYPPEDVFNLVETGLFYRALPGHSPITNDWLSVAFICNMAGTEKKRLLAVGRSEAPLCFRVTPLPLVYKQSSSGGMTEDIICELLQDWNWELAEANRKVALILDSSPSHSNVELSHIALYFVPEESSRAQPLSDGVVGHAKALYRKKMARSTRLLRCKPGKISLIDALFVLAEAWENVPKTLLVSKFLKSTFPQNSAMQPRDDSLDEDEIGSLNRLDDEIQLHSDYDGLPSLHFQDTEVSPLDGGHVVHMEGTLKLSDEEEEDFDIDSLLREEVTDYPSLSDTHRNSTPAVGSKLKLFLQNPSAPKSPTGPPSGSEVRGALTTIKRFLQYNGCTLEDLTDYTQLELKVLSKIKNTSG